MEITLNIRSFIKLFTGAIVIYGAFSSYCLADFKLSEGEKQVLRSENVELDIPGQSLKSALVEFALQASIDFIVNSELVAEYHSVPLVGYYSLGTALEQFLGKTPLAFEIQGRTIVLSFDERKAQLFNGYSEGENTSLSLIEEVIVTSRRREEALVDVPMSIVAVDGDTLDSQGVTDFFKFGLVTPNLTVSAIRGTNSTMTAFIRGVGQDDPLVGFESGVGIYLDDVYINRPQSILADIYDTERIEVLRGPQGTLYGQNSIGGAIKYVSNPLKDEANVKLKVSAGSYDQRDMVLSIGGAVLDTRWKFGGTAVSLERSGFGRNLYSGEENYNKDIRAYRFSSEVDLTESVNVKLSTDKSNDNSSPKIGRRLFSDNLFELESYYDGRSAIGSSSHPANLFSQESSGTSLRLELGSDDFQIKLVHGVREDDTQQPLDIDATVAVRPDTFVDYKNKQISHELQLLKVHDKYRLVSGAYYLNSDAFNAFDIVWGEVNAVRFSKSRVRSKSKAVFLDFDFNITNNFNISAGARYTKEAKMLDIERNVFLGISESELASPYFGGDLISIINPVYDGDGNQIVPQYAGKRTDNIVTPRFGLSWHPRENLHFYAAYSKGYKGAGFDPRGDYSLEIVQNGFNPETLDSYEIGLKSISDTLETNIAVFFNNHNSVQIDSGGYIGGGGSGGNAGTIMSNDGSIVAKGIELELSYKPTYQTDFAFSFGWIDAKYDRYIDVFENDYSDWLQVIQLPKINAGFSLSYHWSLLGGQATTTVVNSYRSKTYLFLVPSENNEQPDYHVTDLSLTWKSRNKRYSFGVYGHNVFDERYKTSIYSLAELGISTVFYGDPRTITASMTFKF